MDWLIALIALTCMEIVLGIDNIVFIAIVTGRLPKEQQATGRLLGLALAMGMRIALLFTLSLILKATQPLFSLEPVFAFFGVAASEEVLHVSLRDIILIGGGLFLVGKSVLEIHHKVEGEAHDEHVPQAANLTGVLVQIAILDIIFSLDSVITAVGMAKELWVMVVAVIAAVLVMMAFSGPVSRFVDKNPTIKVLALAFLILIGVMLLAEGIGTHIDKGYIYFAMAFSLAVEALNIRMRRKATPSE